MQTYKLSQILENITEKRMPTPEDKDTYVGLEHLDTGSLSVKRWGSAVEIKGQKLVMHKGDLLFGRRNTYLKRAAIAPHDGLFSAHGMIFRPKTDVIDPSFFPYFILSDYFMDEAIRISVGSLSPTVNWGTLKDLEFKLPELEEQRKYAQVLAAMNDLKEKYENLLLKTDELVKSQFIEMFDGKGYPECRLKDVCKKITDGTHKTPKYQTEGITFVSAKNIVEGKLDFSDVKYITQEEYDEIQRRCQTEIGDVLMAKSGSLGTLAVVETEKPIGLFESLAVLKYDRKRLDGIFLKVQLQSEKAQAQLKSGVKGVAVKHLHLNVISEIVVIVPPMEIQKEFSDFIQQSDKSKSFEEVAA
jgi:type I restriction enzyme S subunit